MHQDDGFVALPISASIPLKLLRVREAFMDYFRPILKEHDITEQQWRIIRYLTDNPSTITIEQISRKVCISSPSLTGVLSRMENSGFITRRTDPEDRRRTYIVLTEKSQQLYEIIGRKSHMAYEQLRVDYGKSEVQVLDGILSTFLQKLDSQDK